MKDTEAASPELVERVLMSLLELRGDWGRLTVHKFAKYDVLIEVCGEGDLLDAYLMFTRELQRYETSTRNVAAAALSIAADYDTVLDRLQEAASQWSPSDALRDQRTARHWSDAGMPIIARDLVTFAQVRGRLGQDLIGIELGGADLRLQVRIVQLTSNTLSRRVPSVSIRHRPDETDSTTTEIDLAQLQSPEASDDDYRARTHTLTIEVPEPGTIAGDRLTAISIMARGAPVPTFFFEDRTMLVSPVRIKLAVYRSLAVIDLVQG